MRNFTKIAEGVAVAPLAAALATHKYLWNQNTLRRDYPGSPHAAVDDIWCRFNEVGTDPSAVIDDRETVPYEGWHVLPIQPLVLDLARYVGSTRVGRVVITRLAPGQQIAPHEDQGAPAEYFSRFHICVANGPGSVFRVGDEHVVMAPGEVWWIDNRIEHEVQNGSADDRIVVIVDLRCE